mgnify:CR=1 FL=1
MRLKPKPKALAAAAVAATPLAAAQARATMPVEGESEFAGSAFVGIAIFAAIVGIVYFVAEENDEPVSP